MPFFHAGPSTNSSPIFSFLLQELQAHYDELQRQLQTTLDQYGVAQRRIQALTAEYEEARAGLEAVSHLSFSVFHYSINCMLFMYRTYSSVKLSVYQLLHILTLLLRPHQAIRARRAAEMQYEEASARIKDLTTINVNLSNAKTKLEQELCVIAGDYDEVSKEFKVRFDFQI